MANQQLRSLQCLFWPFAGTLAELKIHSATCAEHPAVAHAAVQTRKLEYVLKYAERVVSIETGLALSLRNLQAQFGLSFPPVNAKFESHVEMLRAVDHCESMPIQILWMITRTLGQIREEECMDLVLDARAEQSRRDSANGPQPN